ncbi:hypothetical protein LCGC14_2910400, partial [marine sediment metagenome]
MKITHSGPSVGFFDGRYLKLDASNDPITGNLLLTPTVDSTTVLQVQKADTTVVLNVDTTNARVGIGIATPLATLDVRGDIFVFDSGNDPRLVLGDSVAAGNWGSIRWNSSGDRIEIGTEAGGVDTLVITETGLVGIGTATPDFELELESGKPTLAVKATSTTETVIGNKDNRLLFLADTATVGTGGEVVWGATDDSPAERWAAITGHITQNNAEGAKGHLRFATKTEHTDTVLTTRMTIDNAGNVGIGVTDPDTLLEVYKVGTQLKLSGGAADFATFAVAA